MTRVTPKSLLLDLLRVTPAAVPVRRLVAVGELFGLESGAMRVALTRLVQRGLVESDERGSYRLAPTARTLGSAVDAWREGDRRLRAWRGDFLCVHLPRGTARGVRQQSQRALERFGLRQGLSGVWLRPDNLRAPRQRIVQDLRALGLAPDALDFTARDFDEAEVQRWLTKLWKPREQAERERRALGELRESSARLDGMPAERALVESFVVGGGAIRALSRDALLPDELCDGSLRRELTSAMQDYDAQGRRLWAGFFTETRLALAPTHAGNAA